MSDANGINRSLVLVVGESTVNCVVVSRVVERMGLKVRAERPSVAAATLLAMEPAIVILDGGAHNRDCDVLLDDLRDRRNATAGLFPAVILLSTANRGIHESPIAPVVDMIVAKPLTVDRLQPAIESLRARNGDFARPLA
ncbi:MAG: response regulator [Mesorhizobium sp.]